MYNYTIIDIEQYKMELLWQTELDGSNGEWCGWFRWLKISGMEEKSICKNVSTLTSKSVFEWGEMLKN
jgi:hypothetical protein